MLLINTTRSLVSHVSYCAGMYFTAAFAGRARFEVDPRLEEEDVLARVVEEAVRGSLFAECTTVRLIGS